jgi:hypothetical protein
MLILQIPFAETGGSGEEIISYPAGDIAIIGSGETFLVDAVADF